MISRLHRYEEQIDWAAACSSGHSVHPTVAAPCTPHCCSNGSGSGSPGRLATGNRPSRSGLRRLDRRRGLSARRPVVRKSRDTLAIHLAAPRWQVLVRGGSAASAARHQRGADFQTPLTSLGRGACEGERLVRGAPEGAIPVCGGSGSGGINRGSCHVVVHHGHARYCAGGPCRP